MNRNGYYGIQTAGAAMSGMLEAYNRNINRLASLQMYEKDMGMRQKQVEWSQKKDTLSAQLNAVSLINDMDKNYNELMKDSLYIVPGSPEADASLASLRGQMESIAKQKESIVGVMRNNSDFFGNVDQLIGSAGTGIPAIPTMSGTDTGTRLPGAPATQPGGGSAAVANYENVVQSGIPALRHKGTGQVFENVGGKPGAELTAPDYGITPEEFDAKTSDLVQETLRSLIPKLRDAETDGFMNMVARVLDAVPGLRKKTHSRFSTNFENESDLPIGFTGQLNDSLERGLLAAGFSRDVSQRLPSMLDATIPSVAPGEISTTGASDIQRADVLIAGFRPRSNFPSRVGAVVKFIPSNIGEGLTHAYGYAAEGIGKVIGGSAGDSVQAHGRGAHAAAEKMEDWAHTAVSPQKAEEATLAAEESLIASAKKNNTYQQEFQRFRTQIYNERVKEFGAGYIMRKADDEQAAQLTDDYYRAMANERMKRGMNVRNNQAVQAAKDTISILKMGKDAAVDLVEQSRKIKRYTSRLGKRRFNVVLDKPGLNEQERAVEEYRAKSPVERSISGVINQVVREKDALKKANSSGRFDLDTFLMAMEEDE